MTPEPVALVEHRAAWAAEFEALAARIVAALGDQVLAVDHIGSTAVPGLVAKDVIDVQVTVARLDAAAVVPRLLAAGFAVRGDPARQDHVPAGVAAADPADWAKLYVVQGPGQRRCHVHVRERGRPNQRYALLVRDYLRADPAAARAYGELKRRLAAALADPGAYPEVKDPASDLLFAAAQRWAQGRDGADGAPR